MSQANTYKPRYTIVYTSKSKVWPYKNSYLRRFYALRARRVQRGGLFRRCVLVATTMKWTQARRFIRPFSRAAGSKNIWTAGKTAYGRPYKRRRYYRDTFYTKQKLRFFHGKMKETAFRRFFRTHLSAVGNRTQSFFSALESSLDRVFFRRRLLPTVYACHQFIHHYGVQLNSKVEHSPRATVAVGDMLSVPSTVWKPFYWDLFCRVYYRRWGLYVRRRRLFTQLKKKLFISKKIFKKVSPSSRYQFDANLFNYFSKKTNKTVSLHSRSQHFRMSRTQTRSKYHFKSFFVRLGKVFNPFVLGKPRFKKTQRNGFQYLHQPFRSKMQTKENVKGLYSSYAVQMKSFLQELQELAFATVDANSFNAFSAFRPLNAFTKSAAVSTRKSTLSYFSRKTFSSTKHSWFYGRSAKPYPYVTQSQSYQKAVFTCRRRLLEYLHQLSVEDTDKVKHYSGKISSTNQRVNATLKKLQHFQKLFLSLRLRKSLVPQVIRFRKQNEKQERFKKEVTGFYRRPFVRSRLMRFYTKRSKKRIRAQKFPRIKGTHFYIPTYLQRDFRTLRSVKIQSPSREDIYYPFRISLAKMYSFYRAKGF